TRPPAQEKWPNVGVRRAHTLRFAQSDHCPPASTGSNAGIRFLRSSPELTPKEVANGIDQLVRPRAHVTVFVVDPHHPDIVPGLSVKHRVTESFKLRSVSLLQQGVDLVIIEVGFVPRL